MASVRGTNTIPELLVRRAAHGMGLRFRLHDRRLPGRPDLVFPRWKTAVFVHGCFWHRHQGCRRSSTPKSNVAFRDSKLDANVRRDEAAAAALAASGWRVVVLWECEVRTLAAARAAIARYFNATCDSS